MSHRTAPPPTRSAFADALIDRLRGHQTDSSLFSAKANEPSKLDQLLEQFEQMQSTEEPTAPVARPLRQVPARQVLAAARIAATFGSEGALHDLLQDRALTVLGGISTDDLSILKDVVAAAFPHQQWQIIVPDIVDGTLAKGARHRFERAITDSLDLISRC